MCVSNIMKIKALALPLQRKSPISRQQGISSENALTLVISLPEGSEIYRTAWGELFILLKAFGDASI